MGIANALKNRPVRVLGFFTAFHSVIYGLGYLTGRGGFDGALVGLAINSLALTNILGVMLLVVGSWLSFAFIRQNPKSIRSVSLIQTVLWLFVTFMYLFNGAYMLALGVGLSWSVVSYYISFASGNRQKIIAYDRTAKAREDSANEDQL